ELIAAGIDLRAALDAIAEAAAGATGADAAVVRVLDDAGCLAARAVSPPGSALAAELTGSRIEVEELGTASDSGSLVVPARLEGRVLGSVELVRAGAPFGAQEAALVDLAAAQLLLALRVLGAESGGGESGARVLETAGEAM